jgi:cytochrome c-type biogenesis protein CcmH/NrfG
MIFFISAAILCAVCVAIIWRALLVQNANKTSRRIALVVALIIPVASMALYVALGSVNMPDFPYARILSENERQTEKRLLEERPLIRALRADPQNETLWIELITLYVETNRPAQARQAYLDALQSVPKSQILKKIPREFFK